MPALVKSSVGSLPGTRLEDATTVWPRSRKNSRKARRTSAALMKGGLLGMGSEGWLKFGSVAALRRAQGVSPPGHPLKQRGYDPLKSPGIAKIWPVARVLFGLSGVQNQISGCGPAGQATGSPERPPDP